MRYYFFIYKRDQEKESNKNTRSINILKIYLKKHRVESNGFDKNIYRFQGQK